MKQKRRTKRLLALALLLVFVLGLVGVSQMTVASVAVAGIRSTVTPSTERIVHSEASAGSVAAEIVSSTPTITALDTSPTMHTDSAHGFSFHAGSEWEVHREQISAQGTSENVIRTRWKLSCGFMHYLLLDVFEDSTGLPIVDWYENHRWVEDGPFPTVPNALVAGCPAAVFIFEVKAKDKADNEDPSPASRSFGVDVTPPETTITGGPSGCIGTADVTFTWTGSDNRTPTAELLYNYKLEGFDVNWSAWTSATSKSYTGLPDENYTFKVKARDGVGHEDPSPAARSFHVDTTPPTGSVLINGGDSTTNKVAVHLDITGDDGPVGCGVTEMRLSNDGFNWEAWEPFATEGQ
jgi:hypothetical protein